MIVAARGALCRRTGCLTRDAYRSGLGRDDEPATLAGLSTRSRQASVGEFRIHRWVLY